MAAIEKINFSLWQAGQVTPHFCNFSNLQVVKSGRTFAKLVRAIPKTLQSKIKIFEQRTSAEKMKNEKILA